jgi:hypothetical protein
LSPEPGVASECFGDEDAVGGNPDGSMVQWKL